MSALDAYINKVYKFVVLYVPILCIFAGLAITILHGLKYYPVAGTGFLCAFDISAVLYLGIGIYLARTGYGENGVVRPDKLRLAKTVLVVILVVQWNAIAYIWPFRDLWAFCILFTIVIALFLT